MIFFVPVVDRERMMQAEDELSTLRAHLREATRLLDLIVKAVDPQDNCRCRDALKKAREATVGELILGCAYHDQRLPQILAVIDEVEMLRRMREGETG